MMHRWRVHVQIVRVLVTPTAATDGLVIVVVVVLWPGRILVCVVSAILCHVSPFRPCTCAMLPMPRIHPAPRPTHLVVVVDAGLLHPAPTHPRYCSDRNGPLVVGCLRNVWWRVGWRRGCRMRCADADGWSRRAARRAAASTGSSVDMAVHVDLDINGASARAGAETKVGVGPLVRVVRAKRRCWGQRRSVEEEGGVGPKTVVLGRGEGIGRRRVGEVGVGACRREGAWSAGGNGCDVVGGGGSGDCVWTHACELAPLYQ